MTKTLAQATVAELDALAEQHDVAEYPAEGLKAEKVEALEDALGDDFTFEVEELPAAPEAEAQIEFALVEEIGGQTVNGADFSHPETGEQVHLDAGETITVRQGLRPTLDAIPFLEAQEA